MVFVSLRTHNLSLSLYIYIYIYVYIYTYIYFFTDSRDPSQVECIESLARNLDLYEFYGISQIP